MQINSLPAGGTVGVVEILVSLVTAVHKAALSSQTLLYQILHARLHLFSEDGFLLKYSDIKTPALGSDFEACSAQPSVLPTRQTI